jgi:hypothetical protein
MVVMVLRLPASVVEVESILCSGGALFPMFAGFTGRKWVPIWPNLSAGLI